MKKALVLIASLLAFSVQATPNGQMFFVTANGGSSNPVFDSDGTTRLGTGFFGQLYVGVDANNLQKVGSALEFSVNNAGLGFIADSGTGVTWLQTVNSTTMPVGGQPGGYVLRAWQGASGSTFETALKTGSSSFVSIPAFGGNDTGNSPTANFPIANLHSSFALVPEPATVALGLFGAAGMLFRRRK